MNNRKNEPSLMKMELSDNGYFFGDGKSIPKVLVFAGPNGSGKSTVFQGFEPWGEYINADNIKISRKCTDLEAALEAEEKRECCLSEKRDFTFETVLSTDRNLDLLRRAKEKGYYIESIFVLTVSVELNVLRIQSRVLAGGHPVPVDKIRNRYIKSLINLPELIELSNACTVVDNTDSPTVIFKKFNYNYRLFENQFWSKDAIEKLTTG